MALFSCLLLPSVHTVSAEGFGPPKARWGSAGSYFPLTTNPRDLGWKFGSLHTGIVPFCFADGHVQHLPVNIDSHILDLLASRDDGQIIPDF